MTVSLSATPVLETKRLTLRAPGAQDWPAWVAFAGTERERLQAQAVTATDTTGAGDAFNAGYMATRFNGGDLQSALSHAQAMAAKVVQHRGAILPRS